LLENGQKKYVLGGRKLRRKEVKGRAYPPGTSGLQIEMRKKKMVGEISPPNWRLQQTKAEKMRQRGGKRWEDKKREGPRTYDEGSAC